MTTCNLQEFLRTFRVAKGQPYTHSALDGGLYMIPDVATTKFIKHYLSVLDSKGSRRLHLSEKHTVLSPILIDLDFRQQHGERRYTVDHIVSFLQEYAVYINTFVNMGNTINFYLMQKGTRPRLSKDKATYKDGVHIVAPGVVTVPEIQEAIRNAFISNEADYFADFGFSNPLDDIIDERVIKRNHWLMYGSNKPEDGDNCFLVTHRVTIHVDDNFAASIVGVSNPYNHTFVTLFSIRNKTVQSNYTERGTEELRNRNNVEREEECFRMTSVSDSKSLMNFDLDVLSDVELAAALVYVLDASRAEKYDSWIQLGLCLHNISESLLDKWVVFSKKSAKFVHGECEKLWNGFQRKQQGGLGIGTLRMWARQDNPKDYSTIVQNNMLYFVQKSISGTHTDVANVVFHMYGHIFKCVRIQQGIWYEFKHHRWRQVENAYTLRQLISTEVFKLYVMVAHLYQSKVNSTYGDDERANNYLDMVAKFNNIAKKLKTTSFKDALIKECGEQCYDAEFLDKLDADPSIIVFENGVFDLKTMRFRDGLPEDYAQLSTGYDYDPNDDCHKQNEIKSFVTMISPSIECAEYLVKVCSYLLHGNKYMEVLWFFTGRGRNGKGTLCMLLDKTFGQYYYEPDVSIVTTTKKSSSGANPEMAKAKGKRVLCSSEPDDEDKASKFRVNKLKQLRGNDLIQARGLFKDFVEFRPQFGMIFQMNDKPDLSKADDAIARTLKVVDFPWQFVPNPTEDYQRKADTTIKQKFMDDLSYRQQFMRLLLTYYEKYVAGNQMIEEPLEVVQATKEYMEENNPVGVWLKDNYNYTGQKEDKVAVDALRSDFNCFTKQALSSKKFGSGMTSLGFKSVNVANKRCYLGLKLRPFADDDFPE